MLKQADYSKSVTITKEAYEFILEMKEKASTEFGIKPTNSDLIEALVYGVLLTDDTFTEFGSYLEKKQKEKQKQKNGK